MRDRYEIAVVTNDIYTEEDAAFLVRNEALPAERIIGVETGGCPHTAIREDASINLEAVDRLAQRFGNLDVVFVESGGDNLAATFSPELSDLTLYVIDVAAGDKIPRKGGPGITRSDLLVINKIDLAPMVGASLEVMDRDARKMRGERPFVFTNLKTGQGLPERHRLHRGARDAASPSAPMALEYVPLIEKYGYLATFAGTLVEGESLLILSGLARASRLPVASARRARRRGGRRAR